MKKKLCYLLTMIMSASLCFGCSEADLEVETTTTSLVEESVASSIEETSEVESTTIEESTTVNETTTVKQTTTEMPTTTVAPTTTVKQTTTAKPTTTAKETTTERQTTTQKQEVTTKEQETTTQKPSPTLSASSSSISLSNEAQTIYITVGGLDSYTTIYDIDDTNIIDCTWGDFNGNTAPLTFSPKTTGTTTVDVYIKNTNVRITINVTVKIPIIITTSSEKISLGDYIGDVDVTVTGESINNLVAETMNPDVAKCSWASGKGNTATLFIYPKSTGSTEIKISIKGTDEQISIPVEVSKSELTINGVGELYYDMYGISGNSYYVGLIKSADYETSTSNNKKINFEITITASCTHTGGEDSGSMDIYYELINADNICVESSYFRVKFSKSNTSYQTTIKCSNLESGDYTLNFFSKD